MKSKVLEIIAKLSDLGFDQQLKEKVKLYFEGSLPQKEYQEIHKLIIFVEEVLDECLFKKREPQCSP
ncbi:MAG: hypothetical protein DRG24_01560 [Epsilonproteobacteria bacterium]|nr:MAG: hypothetical protein DRG24_01560 [Campylobacterota bacterium]